MPLLSRHGEGQDGDARARKEGDGGGERQEDESGVVIEVCAAAGLDLGRLDPIFALARGFGGAVRLRFDRYWGREAAGGGDEASAAVG